MALAGTRLMLARHSTLALHLSHIAAVAWLLTTWASVCRTRRTAPNPMGAAAEAHISAAKASVR